MNEEQCRMDDGDAPDNPIYRDCHDKRLEAQPEDIAILCPKCAALLVDVEGNRKLINQLSNNIGKSTTISLTIERK